MKDNPSYDLSAEMALLTPSTNPDQYIHSVSSSAMGSPFSGDSSNIIEAQFDPLDKYYSSCPPIEEKLESKGLKQNGRILIYSFKNEPLYINRFDDISPQLWKKILTSDFFWIDIFQPTPKELDLFQEVTIETISFGNSGEILESFHNYKFLSTLAPKNKPLSPETILAEKVEIFNIFSVILANGILTFQKESLTQRIRVLERISKIGNSWTLSPGWIAYALLDEVVDSLIPLLRVCEEEAEKFEDLILNLDSSITRSSSTHSLNQIARLKQHVFTISKLVSQKHDICQILTKKVIDPNDFKDGMHLYFGDVQDHILSLSQGCFHLEKNLTTTHLNYCDQLTLACIQTDHATFDQTMLLTYVGSAISVLICIAGFFGINTYIPSKYIDNTSRKEPYYVILAIALLISILTGYLSHIYAVKKIKKH